VRKILCLLHIFLAMLCCETGYSAVNEADLLPVDQAFIFQFRLEKNHTLEFYWEIAPGYYLYQEQLKLIDADNTPLIKAYTLPTGIILKDSVLGDYTVFANNLIFTIPWSENFANNSIMLRYQGCAQDGFCYAPVNKIIHINKDFQVQINDTTLQEFTTSEHPDSESDKLAATIKNRFLPFTLIVFFLLGILLSFSPCVLPMIPLVINLIVGPKPISTHKALILASSYVLGMAGSYAIAGMLVGILGSTLQSWLQQPGILISLSVLLVMLALAQFDMLKIKLPHFNKKLHHWGQRQLQGSLPGAFILGIISALIVSPCITAPLIGALTYIGHDGNPVIGALTLFSLGLGMGVPLIGVALLSSVILPAAGPWMNLIKSGSGIAMLGLAIWILERIIPAELALILWGALCLLGAALVNAYKTQQHRKHTKRILKIIAVILALYGVGVILTAITHKQNIVAGRQWHSVETTQDLKMYLAQAQTKQQPTLVEFYATWCTSCKKIEAEVFPDPEIRRQLEQFMLLRVDITNMDPQQHELLTSLQIYGPPAILVFNKEGIELKEKRMVGNVDVAEMLAIMRGVLHD